MTNFYCDTNCIHAMRCLQLNNKYCYVDTLCTLIGSYFENDLLPVYVLKHKHQNCKYGICEYLRIITLPESLRKRRNILRLLKSGKSNVISTTRGMVKK